MIKLKNSILMPCMALAVAALSSCDVQDDMPAMGEDGAVAVRLVPQSMMEGTASDAESRVNTLSGYRFENGVLDEVFSGLTVDDDGICRFYPSRADGRVYFLANASDVDGMDNVRPDVTTEDDFLGITATSESMVVDGIVMTGRMELAPGSTHQPASASLKRSVARIDLDPQYKGVEVHSVTLKDIADRGYVNVQDDARQPGTAETADMLKSFDGQPFKQRKATLFYLCEQGGGTHEVEVAATMNGAWQRLRTTLPPIRRNTVYTLKVYGVGASLKVEVLSDEWESGVSSGSALESKGWIDRSASTMSEGVRLNERGDTLFIPYMESSAQLALLAESGIEVRVNGLVEGATVTTRKVTRNMQKVATVDVASAYKLPGSVQEYVYLDLFRQNVQVGRIVLSFAPNPVDMEGILKFDADRVCDLGRYADGRLATFTVGGGKVMRLEFDNGEPQWARLDAGGQDNVYCLEGGWRPNDPEADGRVQTLRLIVSDFDGGNAETYTVKRRNWGLPVVNVNGVWWCKYNLRGDVKDFNDQILVKSDPVGSGSVADYLKSCSDEEFLSLLGDQYQAGNTKGLKLTYDGADFHYAGFDGNINTDFGSLNSTAMAPDGYEVPGYNHYRFFAWGNDCGLGYGSNAFNNQLGQRLTYTITERVISVDGGEYGPINYYDFNYNGAHWVMLGLGNQSGGGTGSLSKMVVLMATSGIAGKTWMLEGYPASSPTGRATWIKYADADKRNTRTIRCVKTPVNYIY